MIRKMMLAAVVVLTGSFSARAEDKPAAPFDDAAFVKMETIGGMSTVYLSELAVTQTKNADVKKFAALLQKEHSEVNEALKAAAKTAEIEQPTKIDDAHQKQYDAFKDYKGDNFDRDYIKTIVESHTKCVALLTQASKEAKNPALKEYAIKTLPTIQKHLDMAKKFDK